MEVGSYGRITHSPPGGAGRGGGGRGGAGRASLV